jgi:hypothetical protein
MNALEKFISKEDQNWAMWLHLSQLAGYMLVPLVGLVVPIVIWSMKRTESPFVDDNGKMVVNWLISAAIYWAIGIVLSFILIGLLIIIPLYVIGIVFPIIGAVKAAQGEIWNYPLTIRFLK